MATVPVGDSRKMRMGRKRTMVIGGGWLERVMTMGTAASETSTEAMENRMKEDGWNSVTIIWPRVMTVKLTVT